MFRASLIAIFVFAAQAASAQDQTGDMLRRAAEKRLPTLEDRQVAEDLLSDWENRGADDPAMQRALQRIVQGSPPADEQLPALSRTLEVYSGRRAVAEAMASESDGSKGSQARPRGGVVGVSRRVISRARGNVLAVGGLGAAVVAGGLGWILLARKRRRV